MAKKYKTKTDIKPGEKYKIIIGHPRVNHVVRIIGFANEEGEFPVQDEALNRFLIHKKWLKFESK